MAILLGNKARTNLKSKKMTVGDLKKFLSDNPQVPDCMDVCIVKSDDEFDVGSVESVYIKKVRFSEDAYSNPGDGSLEAYGNVLILHDEYLTPEEIEEYKRKAENSI